MRKNTIHPLVTIPGRAVCVAIACGLAMFGTVRATQASIGSVRVMYACLALAQQKSSLDKPEEEPSRNPPARPAAGPGSSSTTPLPAAPGTNQPSSASQVAGNQHFNPHEEALCDIIHFKSRGTPATSKIRFYPHVLKFPLPEDREYTFAIFVKNETGSGVLRLRGRDITLVEYYEARLWRMAKRTLAIEDDRLALLGNVLRLDTVQDSQRAALAETILNKAITEHDSAVQRNLREDPDWNVMFRQPMANALFNLQLSQLDRLIKQQLYQQAETTCDRLHAGLSRSGNFLARSLVRDRCEQIFMSRAEQAFAADDYELARQFVAQLTSRFPLDTGPRTRALRERMIAEAAGLMRQAEQLEMKSPREAGELLDRARQVWPQLEGLDERQRQLGLNYPVIDCAYSELPRNFLPRPGRLPVERHAAALLLESLVRWSSDAPDGPHYTPQLGDGWPDPVARGRRFYLPLCQWADSRENDPHYCTVEDVRWTIKLMKNQTLVGHSQTWEQLVEGVDGADSDDPLVACIKLGRDFWQPLALLDFKILPKHCFPSGGNAEELRRFNEQPVGTGPYRIGERNDNRVRFVANRSYRVAGLPKIREITFHRLDGLTAVDQFLQGKLQLIFDVRPEHVTQLERQGRMVQKLHTPSVWFLAPNYRRPALRNQNLRLAIAHAIDRRSILDQYFCPGGNRTCHAELSGPFPDDSWAAVPNAPRFAPPQATLFAKAALDELYAIPRLSLAYPSGSPEIEAACKQMQSQLKPHGINLELEPVAPDSLVRKVVLDQSFDLVYWRHDFEDETYWLWPLLDPTAKAPGGTNFMGYDPDPSIAEFFQDVTLHKHFPTVQAVTQKLHSHIARTAALIPLWQLDTFVAVADELKSTAIDPLDLFVDIQNWNIKAGDLNRGRN